MCLAFTILFYKKGAAQNRATPEGREGKNVWIISIEGSEKFRCLRGSKEAFDRRSRFSAFVRSVCRPYRRRGLRPYRRLGRPYRPSFR